MNAINTTLTTSGNSVAVRLPKNLLQMSGLGKNVKLEAKQGRIIISRLVNPRDGWEEQLKAIANTSGLSSREFDDMKAASNDGLDNLLWDGPSYEDWEKGNAKLS